VTGRAALIVLDGVGIGRAHDQDDYGDAGSDTLGNVLAAAGRGAAPAGFALPNLAALGLGNCAALPLVPPAAAPRAAHGTAQPRSAGKDSTTGHWELCGLVLERPFPLFPQGFPRSLIAEFSRETGRAVIGNQAASGTAILDELGAEHQRTGAWIVYTSADSVLQIAAHEETVPLAELYRACEVARRLCAGPWGVSRVIARPFLGRPGSFTRTPRRKDYSLEPPGATLLDELARAGIARLGVGKVDDLFAGRGISSTHTPTNEAAYRLLEQAMGTLAEGLVLANVIEFDQTWGHRNDVPAFLAGLVELDRAIPRLLRAVQRDDLVIFTADHGNDPTTPSTDHSRERVPVLVYGPRARPVSIGERASFADIGQTVAEFFGVGPLGAGRSFLREVWDG
jgi:phosphopentomutase